MTNINDAAEVLWLLEPHLSTSECDDQARELAQALADAGYLMPDLPVPDREGYWWPKAATLGNVSRTSRGEIRIQSGNFQNFQMYLTPEKALDLAAILTAAATEEA